MKAIQLIRVSTGRQDLDQQRDAVMQRVINDGYSPDDIISIEDVESGVLLSEEERNGLNKMKTCIESDPSICAVYVYEISRLSRRPKVIFSIRDYLQDHKIQLIVLNPEMKIFNPDWSINSNANLLFTLFVGQAENEGYERKLRTFRGKQKAKNEGRYMGGFIRFGYDVDKKTKKMIINAKEYEVIRFIVELYLKGTHSQYSIAQELIKKGFKTKSGKDFIHTNIAHILRDTNYLGNNMYPQIITPEEWKKLRSLVDKRQNKVKHKRGKAIYYGKRKFFCKDDNNHYFAMCVRRSTNVYTGSNGTQRFNINLNQLDSLIWTFAKELRLRKINDPDAIEEEKESIKDKIEKLNNDIQISLDIIDKEKARIEKIEERFLLDRISEDKANELEERSRDLITENKSLINQYKSEIDQLSKYTKGLDKKVNIDIDTIENLKDDVLRKQIIDEEIERIVFVEKRAFCEYIIKFEIYHGISFYFILYTHNSKREVYRYAFDKDKKGNIIKEWTKPYPVEIENRF